MKFNKRYEQKDATGEGDAYNAYYLGLNYYIYQHMTAVEYFDMANVATDDGAATENGSGWSFISGIRLYSS